MKLKLWSAFAAFGLLACQAQKESFSPDALREKLLTIEQKDIAFSEILAKHKGKTIVVEVWASWCGDCIKAMPLLKETQKKFPNTNYVFISMDKTHEKWLEGIEKYALTGDHYLATNGMKGSFGKAINLDWIPRYMIIDKQGKVVVYRAIEKDFDLINQTLEKLQ